jgi:hypothetical protein
MNVSLNKHGLVAIVFVVLILLLTLIKAQQIEFLAYGGIAIILYTFFIFRNIRSQEQLLSDKRRIISAQDHLDIFRQLVGWHIMAGLALLGFFVPLSDITLAFWLVVSIIAGVGIPYIIFQQKES